MFISLCVITCLGTAADGVAAEIDGPAVADAFAIGAVAFVVPDSELSKGSPKQSDLSKLFGPATAVRHGAASLPLRKIIETELDFDIKMTVRRVSAVNLGDTGFVWHVTWDLSGVGMGGSGIAPQYRAFVRADRQPIAPKLYLRDSLLTADDRTLFSVLPFARMVGDSGVAPTPEKRGSIVAKATAALDTILKKEELPLKLRFQSVERRTFPWQGPGGQNRVLEAFAVKFVDAEIPRGERVVNSSRQLSVWVTRGLEVAELSCDGWSARESKARKKTGE